MKINNKDKTFIENACHFLGPKGEQREFITKMLELAFNDHIYWRRNFFPKDPPLIPYSYLRSDEFNQYTEKFTQEFFLLLGELKTSVPNFSPRYMCHMNSDPSLAAMISYLAAIFYNANNVTPEASPVTLKLEMMAILDLIEMFYFPREQSFGHLCSGGTVANYHSIYYHRIFKFLPLTVILLAEKFQLITKKTILKKSIIDYLYFSFEETTQFISEVKKLFENKFKDKKSFDEELNQFNFLKLGERKFTSQVSEYFNSEFPELVILCPTSAHYSWKKACGILGLGQDQLISLPLQADYSTCPTQFEKIVIELKQKNIAILQTVFISGTTELGIFDNLSELMKKVNKLRKNKIHFPVHVDGAYGGYYQSINIIEKNGLFNKAKTIPIYSKTCAQRMKGIELVDSITIDPHKLGFAPYGAGAFITRHGHLKKYLSEKAEYIFSEKSQQQLKSSSNEKNKTSPQFLDWNFPLGKYILEGSKSGAMATSVYFSHKMMPLEQNGLGSYLNQLNKVAFEFQKKLDVSNITQNKNQSYLFGIPFPRHSNIVCFFIYRPNMTLNQLNELNEKIYQKSSVSKLENIQDYDFIISKTQMSISENDFLKKYLIDECQIKIAIKNTDKLFILRTVFMNQWPISTTKDYLSEFINFLLSRT